MPAKKASKVNYEKMAVNKIDDIGFLVGDMYTKSLKTKKDLHETRTILYVILAINMALLGLVAGLLIKLLG